jgi:hypothetical protein
MQHSVAGLLVYVPLACSIMFGGMIMAVLSGLGGLQAVQCCTRTGSSSTAVVELSCSVGSSSALGGLASMHSSVNRINMV